MHSNGQRPGAVTNMTTEELDKALQSEPVVVCVKEHKTDTTGTPRLIIQDDLVPFLKIHATTIRPSLILVHTAHWHFLIKEKTQLTIFQEQ